MSGTARARGEGGAHGNTHDTQLVSLHGNAPPAGRVARASRSIIARFAREKRRAGFCSSRYWAATPSKWPGSYGLPANHESACATRAASSSSVTTSSAIWIGGATTPLVRRALSSAAGVVASVEQRLVPLRNTARMPRRCTNSQRPWIRDKIKMQEKRANQPRTTL
jgi:hypothetical protein